MEKIIRRIGEEYPKVREGVFKRNAFADFVTKEAAESFRSLAERRWFSLKVDASVGKGQWAEVPWIAFLRPTVTKSVQQGFFVVYLFDSKQKVVYLSLNQGATGVYTDFGEGTQKALNELKTRAQVLRAKINDINRNRLICSIDLSSNKLLPKGYKAGHVIGFRYEIDNLPDESVLSEDLLFLLKEYALLDRDGAMNLGFIGEGDHFLESVVEKKTYSYHLRIDRTPQAKAVAKKGKLIICEACGFDFLEAYGELGKDYIESHHLISLGSLSDGEEVVYHTKDFALLCANCHRMIHRMKDCSDIQKLKDIIKIQKNL